MEGVLKPEIDSDCGDVALLELVVCKPAKNGGFAD
jgi:hypothetical protein